MTWRELFIGLLLMGIKWRFDPRTQTALPNEHFKVGGLSASPQHTTFSSVQLKRLLVVCTCNHNSSYPSEQKHYSSSSYPCEQKHYSSSSYPSEVLTLP